MAAVAMAAVTGAAQVYQGAQAKKLKREEELAFQDAAQRRIAAGTLDVAEERRNAEFAYSRALAVAAAGGSDASAAGVSNLLSDITAEGEYRVLATMFNAQTDAGGLQFRADEARKEGDAAMTAGVIRGVTSAVSTFSKMKGGFGGRTRLGGGSGS